MNLHVPDGAPPVRNIYLYKSAPGSQKAHCALPAARGMYN